MPLVASFRGPSKPGVAGSSRGSLSLAANGSESSSRHHPPAKRIWMLTKNSAPFQNASSCKLCPHFGGPMERFDASDAPQTTMNVDGRKLLTRRPVAAGAVTAEACSKTGFKCSRAYSQNTSSTDVDEPNHPTDDGRLARHGSWMLIGLITPERRGL